MKTLEEFAHDNNIHITSLGLVNRKAIIEFAKYHVEEALKQAAQKATMKLTYPDDYADSNESGLKYADAHEIERGGEYGSVQIETDTILNAYSLDNIV